MRRSGPATFAGRIEFPKDRRVRNAELMATADDSFVAFVNGQKVGEGRSWAEVKLFDVTQRLRTGVNTIAIAATNSASPNVGPDKNPAGLIGMLKVEFDDGEPLLVPTDSHWRAGDRRLRVGSSPAFDDAGWARPREPGPVRDRHRGVRSAGRTIADCLRECCAPRSGSPKEVRRATASVCGLGFFDLHFNGQSISDQLMNPALTGYDRRVLLRHV